MYVCVVYDTIQIINTLLRITIQKIVYVMQQHNTDDQIRTVQLNADNQTPY
jgi:hypothetical protein